MVSLSESYEYARKLTRARATNFYTAFLFLPRERRRAIYAVYAFSRRADDAVDAVEEAGVSEEEARRRLGELRALVAGAAEDPLAPAIEDAIRRFAIPRRHFEDLLAGMEMDLERKEYDTFEELYRYCYHVASVVGFISLEIFGHSGPEARGPAERLGIAMQLTNIVRDVAEDLDRGRRYLPREDLDRFSYRDEELRRRVVDRRFRDLVRFEVARARRYFDEARALFPLVRKESRYCPVLLARLYGRILDRVERQDYDVLTKRPRLSAREKLAVAGRLWLDSLRGAL